MNIKNKGDTKYKCVSVEYFGRLPNFNFTKLSDLSPGSPGERTYGNREQARRPRKRTNRSESNSPNKHSSSKPRIEDISYDKAGMTLE